MSSTHEVFRMREHDPENQWKHRDAKIDSFDTIHFRVSVAKCKYDNHELADRIREWGYDRTEWPQFITREENADSGNLIEEPSDNIWLGFSDHNRVDVSKWWGKNKDRWNPCSELIERDSVSKKGHIGILSESIQHSK